MKKKREYGKDRSAVFRIRLTDEERGRLADAAEANEQDTSTWARSHLLAQAEADDEIEDYKGGSQYTCRRCFLSFAVPFCQEDRAPFDGVMLCPYPHCGGECW